MFAVRRSCIIPCLILSVPVHTGKDPSYLASFYNNLYLIYIVQEDAYKHTFVQRACALKACGYVRIARDASVGVKAKTEIVST